jgi:hypothetical protein
VVADGGRVEPDAVEGLDRRPAFTQVGDQGALHLVATVEPKRGAGTRRLE